MTASPQPDPGSPPPPLPDDATATAEEVTRGTDDASDRIGYGRFGRWTPLALTLLLIAALVAIGIAGQSDADDLPPAGSGPHIGALAPDFALTQFDGRPLHLHELRGRTVVLNFWASWCEPCEAEMPALQRLAATVGDDVVLVGVGLKNDDAADARAFVARYGITYPVGRDLGGPTTGPSGPIETAYGIVGAPTTIVIAPDGTIATIALGPQTEDQLRALLGDRG
ncbi:MAG: TlpA family protein disulfide reductase [Chloroflexia bacterium]|nr:TlpA family protein disulfide reductase [Chloroflexia bacterium]